MPGVWTCRGVAVLPFDDQLSGVGLEDSWVTQAERLSLKTAGDVKPVSATTNRLKKYRVAMN